MIESVTGNLLEADVEALVNAVNTVGVMGKGIALQFRQTFPSNYTAYRAACKRGDVQPGHMFIVELDQPTHPRLIINFPTKRHWRDSSRLEDIDSGLAALIGEVRSRGIRSIAIPALGCGLGGLRWDDVRPRIVQTFAVVPEVRVLLYEPA